MELYFGSYENFETASKDEGAMLTGPDNIIGDRYSIVFEGETAWLLSRFEKKVGFFNANLSRRLRIMAARGWKCQALLSLVFYSDTPEPGRFWGEAVVICYDPSLADSAEPFIGTISEMLAEGLRPDIELGEAGVQKMQSSAGTWKPEGRIKKPQTKAGTVLMKDHRSVSEGFIEQGRKGNIGCYIVSIAFIVVVVAAIILLVKHFFF